MHNSLDITLITEDKAIINMVQRAMDCSLKLRINNNNTYKMIRRSTTDHPHQKRMIIRSWSTLIFQINRQFLHKMLDKLKSKQEVKQAISSWVSRVSQHKNHQKKSQLVISINTLLLQNMNIKFQDQTWSSKTINIIKGHLLSPHGKRWMMIKTEVIIFTQEVAIWEVNQEQQ